MSAVTWKPGGERGGDLETWNPGLDVLIRLRHPVDICMLKDIERLLDGQLETECEAGEGGGVGVLAWQQPGALKGRRDPERWQQCL